MNLVKKLFIVTVIFIINVQASTNTTINENNDEVVAQEQVQAEGAERLFNTYKDEFFTVMYPQLISPDSAFLPIMNQIPTAQHREFVDQMFKFQIDFFLLINDLNDVDEIYTSNKEFLYNIAYYLSYLNSIYIRYLLYKKGIPINQFLSWQQQMWHFAPKNNSFLKGKSKPSEADIADKIKEINEQFPIPKNVNFATRPVRSAPQSEQDEFRLAYNNQNKREEERNKIVQTGNYKMHLMPFFKDVPYVVSYFLEAIAKDPELQEVVRHFKYKQFAIKDITALENEDRQKATAKVIPRIVIYSSWGKEAAQKLLNKLIALFGNTPGADITPRYNQRVTSLLYFAQGDGDYKSGSDTNYEMPDKIYFNQGYTLAGRNNGYHLEIPSIPNFSIMQPEGIQQIPAQLQNTTCTIASTAQAPAEAPRSAKNAPEDLIGELADMSKKGDLIRLSDRNDLKPNEVIIIKRSDNSERYGYVHTIEGKKVIIVDLQRQWKPLFNEVVASKVYSVKGRPEYHP